MFTTATSFEGSPSLRVPVTQSIPQMTSESVPPPDASSTLAA